jgi:hypothetical protein
LNKKLRCLHPLRPVLDDLEFAEKQKAGLAFYSSGNSITTTTIRPRPRPKLHHNEHMNPALIGDASAVNPFASHEIEDIWHPEAKAARKKMYADSDERQPTEQERKTTLDHAAITAAFRHGYSR